jgi:hypothetical protein
MIEEENCSMEVAPPLWRLEGGKEMDGRDAAAVERFVSHLVHLQ